jgi:hypothetical protein
MLLRTEEVMGGQGDWDKASWRKSNRSGTDGGCVSLAASDACIAVRDTKDPGRTTILLPRAVLGSMLEEIKKGTFDLRR